MKWKGKLRKRLNPRARDKPKVRRCSQLHLESLQEGGLLLIGVGCMHEFGSEGLLASSATNKALTNGTGCPPIYKIIACVEVARVGSVVVATLRLVRHEIA